ncbi:MAG TPA: MFS transporter [Pseudomonadales bacterium]|jgi:predicted MFS family arabinose efflux permease
MSTQRGPDAPESKRYRWYALGVLVLVFTSSHVDRQIMGILLEPIKQELGASDTQMGFLVGITFAIFYATLGVPIAMLADRFNRRNIIVWAITMWSAMTALCGYAQTFAQLALARIGVGVGEAGSNPPSHSMISDMFPVHERATAMAIFASGINLGLLIAYLGGGWMSEHWGWRATFFAVGLPGLLIAMLVRLTLAEPARGGAEAPGRPDSTRDAPALAVVARTMMRTRSVRHIVVGASLAVFVGYGMVLWLPAFFVRSHGLSQTQVGLTLALLSGVVGAIGTLASGRIADLLARRDLRWTPWVVALAKIATVPFSIWFFATTDFRQALLIYLVPAFFGGFYLGPGFAMVQSLMPLRMRAVAAAISLFVGNLVGLGLGPQGVGLLSDLLAPRFGIESLRYALMAFACLNLWAALHYWLASHTLAEDLARAGATTDVIRQPA